MSHCRGRTTLASSRRSSTDVSPSTASPAVSMPRADRVGWAVRGTALGLLLGVAGFWGLALVPQPPASSPMRLVADSIPLPATPAALEPAAGGAQVAVRLLFAGDIMQHRRQAREDFRHSYARVAPLIGRADLAIANLE